MGKDAEIDLRFVRFPGDIKYKDKNFIGYLLPPFFLLWKIEKTKAFGFSCCYYFRLLEVWPYVCRASDLIQLFNYLWISKCKVGVLMNFHNSRCEIRTAVL